MLKNSHIFLATVILFNFIFSKSYFENKRATYDLSIPSIFEVKVLDTYDLPEIYSEDIKIGFVELEQFCTVSVSSNVPWKLSFYTNQENLYRLKDKGISIENVSLSLDKNTYFPFSNHPVEIYSSERSTSNQIFYFSLRRELTWFTTPKGEWYIEPTFLVEPLYE